MQTLTAKIVHHFSRPTLKEIKALSTELKTRSTIFLSTTVEEDLSKWTAVIKVKLFNHNINRKKILYIFQEDSYRVKLDVSTEYREGKGQKPSKYSKRSYYSTNLEELKAQIKNEFDRWSFD